MPLAPSIWNRSFLVVSSAVTAALICWTALDSVSVAVGTAVFADGFESGDTSSWSASVP